ncbi:MAG: T9SS type A sorting domain-containing protein [bacterium]
MYNKTHLLAAAIFLATLGFATVQMRAEIPIIQADTVYYGFPGGEVTGIVFGPTGETVILMHDAQPVEINIKTKQIMREFEKVPNSVSSNPSFFINKQNNYLGAKVYSSDYFSEQNISGIILWDLQTGKIVNSLPHLVLQTNCDQYFSLFISSDKKYLGKYDINTFKYIDSIYLPKDIPGFGYAEWGAIGIIPNSNKVLAGVNRYTLTEQGDKKYYLAELYVVDFDTKQYTKVPIPYETGQYRSEIHQIIVTESGKYNIIEVENVELGTTFFIYDQNFSFKYKLGNKDFVNMTDIQIVNTNTIITPVTDDYLLFSMNNYQFNIDRMAFFNIQSKTVSKYLGFIGNGVYDKYSKKIGLRGTILGLTGVYNLEALPVKDLPKTNIPELVYKNNQLEYNSVENFIGDSQIYDTTGKMILSLGTKNFIKGKNLIRINQNLPTGIYLLTIKNGTNQLSYKFVVE